MRTRSWTNLGPEPAEPDTKPETAELEPTGLRSEPNRVTHKAYAHMSDAEPPAWTPTDDENTSAGLELVANSMRRMKEQPSQKCGAQGLGFLHIGGIARLVAAGKAAKGGAIVLKPLCDGVQSSLCLAKGRA